MSSGLIETNPRYGAGAGAALTDSFATQRSSTDFTPSFVAPFMTTRRYTTTARPAAPGTSRLIVIGT